MQKRSLFLVMVLVVLSSACSGSQTTPTETAVPTISAIATKASPTATATVLAPTATATSEVSLIQAPPGCSTFSLLPTPSPTEVALFPAEQKGDWALGPVTAAITILEYSDFQ